MIAKNLLKAVLILIIFLMIMVLLGIFYEREIARATEWVVQHIGFPGLCAILLVTDTFVTPVPPDILLVVVTKSHLSNDWLFYVSILGGISTCAGMMGWAIGRWLGHKPLVRRMFGNFQQEHRDFLTKYGFWAVLTGATTPLPFSVTCWTAGVMEIPWQHVLAGSIFRIPRFLLYYWVISYSDQLQRLVVG